MSSNLKIGIIAQEEPVHFSPFLRSIIEARHADVKVVVIAGKRGAGNHPKSLKDSLIHLYMLWLMMEPKGFLKSLGIRIMFKMVQFMGTFGRFLDRRSVKAIARKYDIPILYQSDLNSQSFVEEFCKFKLDVVVNQTEIILKDETLSVPRLGFINRHASLLPRFRGRVGSFWSHAAEPPEYGVTIHFVSKEIDAGNIIIQKQYDVDSRYSYAQVLEILFEHSKPLVLEALDLLEDPNFKSTPNDYKSTKAHSFPSLQDIKSYRISMRIRRSRRVS